MRHGAHAASNMSARVDPAKRYGLGSPQQPQPAESTSGSDSDRARNGGAGEVAQQLARKGRGARAGPVPKTPSPTDPGALLGLVAGQREVVGENGKDQ